MAEIVFNKCVSDNGKQPDTINYEIRLNYELLEDVYEDWCSSTADPDSISVSSTQPNLPEPVGIYQRINGKNEEEESIRQLENKANHPLMLMVRCAALSCFQALLVPDPAGDQTALFMLCRTHQNLIDLRPSMLLDFLEMS